MKKADLQSYLNWLVYLFRARRDEDKCPKTARVLRHLPMSDARYRSSRQVIYPHDSLLSDSSF